MTVEINKIDESYIKINCGEDLALELSDNFSFYTENYKWSPKYRAGIWDGKIRLFNRRNCQLPIGLYDDLIIYFRKNNIKYENNVENTFGPNLSSKFINKFWNELLKCDLKLRDYQIESIKQSLKYKKLILLSATGSGKSAILFGLINLLKYMDDEFKSLLVVPTSSLVYQMREDFIEYGKNFCNMDDYIHIIKGKEKETTKPLSITTWQAVQSMHISSSYFAQFHGIFCDECLHPDTKISLSKNKTKKIKNLKSGDKILSFNEQTQKIEEDVIIKIHKNLYNSKSEKRYKIKFDDGSEIIVTGNHKIYTERGKKRVDELKIGEMINEF